MNIPDEPAPSLHPHLQTAGASQLLRTGPPANTATVLNAFGFCLGALPLTTTRPKKTDRAVDSIDVRLLTFRARAADQSHAAYMPGTTWPVNGYPPGSSQGSEGDPGFDANCSYDTYDDT